jgi:nicotinate-nucleotide--dimethylbenzimidazole phosphoribosyltransferase
MSRLLTSAFLAIAVAATGGLMSVGRASAQDSTGTLAISDTAGLRPITDQAGEVNTSLGSPANFQALEPLPLVEQPGNILAPKPDEGNVPVAPATAPFVDPDLDLFPVPEIPPPTLPEADLSNVAPVIGPTLEPVNPVVGPVTETTTPVADPIIEPLFPIPPLVTGPIDSPPDPVLEPMPTIEPIVDPAIPVPITEPDAPVAAPLVDTSVPIDEPAIDPGLEPSAELLEPLIDPAADPGDPSGEPNDQAPQDSPPVTESGTPRVIEPGTNPPAPAGSEPHAVTPASDKLEDDYRGGEFAAPVSRGAPLGALRVKGEAITALSSNAEAGPLDNHTGDPPASESKPSKRQHAAAKAAAVSTAASAESAPSPHGSPGGISAALFADRPCVPPVFWALQLGTLRPARFTIAYPPLIPPA